MRPSQRVDECERTTSTEAFEERSRMRRKRCERTKASCLSPGMIFYHVILAKEIHEGSQVSELSWIKMNSPISSKRTTFSEGRKEGRTHVVSGDECECQDASSLTLALVRQSKVIAYLR